MSFITACLKMFKQDLLNNIASFFIMLTILLSLTAMERISMKKYIT